jgi:hypothetical protein
MKKEQLAGRSKSMPDQDAWGMARIPYWLTPWVFYRPLMRLAHRFNWHHAPMHGPLEDGAMQRWCQWCGFRETYRQSRRAVTERVTGAGSSQNEGSGPGMSIRSGQSL